MYTSSKNLRLRSDNSYAITKSQEYIQIVNFIRDGDKGFVIYKFLHTQSISEDANMPIKKIVGYANEESAENISELNKICVFLTISNENYICAVPHQHYY